MDVNGFFGKPIYTLNGFTLTVGMVFVLIVVYLVYKKYIK